MIVPALPLTYTTVWIHGVPYYYANEIYYTRTPGGYAIVEPPQEEVSETAPENLDAVDDRIFIYPRQGQSQEQQEYDRYECHQWAVEQTNYDPTRPPSGLSQNQIMQKRSDYQEEMINCLDHRGYTVK
jgi:hypothetical protein